MAVDTLNSLEGLQGGILSPHRIAKLRNDFEGQLSLSDGAECCL